MNYICLIKYIEFSIEMKLWKLLNLIKYMRLFLSFRFPPTCCAIVQNYNYIMVQESSKSTNARRGPIFQNIYTRTLFRNLHLEHFYLFQYHRRHNREKILDIHLEYIKSKLSFSYQLVSISINKYIILFYNLILFQKSK